MTLRKYLTKNFENLLDGTPILAPQSAVSPKMTTPALPLPHFLIQNLFFSKNVDVCKKVELNMLRFDKDMRGLN